MPHKWNVCSRYSKSDESDSCYLCFALHCPIWRESCVAAMLFFLFRRMQSEHLTHRRHGWQRIGRAERWYATRKQAIKIVERQNGELDSTRIESIATIKFVKSHFPIMALTQYGNRIERGTSTGHSRIETTTAVSPAAVFFSTCDWLCIHARRFRKPYWI